MAGYNALNRFSEIPIPKPSDGFMSDVLEYDLVNSMRLLPEGEELLRTFRDPIKWISSDYRLGIPSRGHNQTAKTQMIEIASFHIAVYPVTESFYNLVMDIEEIEGIQGQRPKVDVSWFDCIRFCNTLSRRQGLTEYYTISPNGMDVECNPGSNGFRLPTEAEWQYACKSGTGRFQYSDLDQIAWHKGNSGDEIHAVGEKAPNVWGLYDMLGNVWEWCWDLFDQEAYRSYRVFRGGSFAEEGRVCGATTRRKSHPDFSIDDLGFRLATSS